MIGIGNYVGGAQASPMVFFFLCMGRTPQLTFGLELLEVVVLLEGNLLRHVLVLVHLHRRHDDALLSSSPLALPRFS